jgi:hypothetical protein
MKNWKNCALIGMVAIIVLVFGFVGCKDKTPDPEWQTKSIEIATGKTVTVKFFALPDTTPTWWNDLKAALINREPGFKVGIYTFTLTVTPTGTDGFDVDADGKATVSEEFLKPLDYQGMRQALNNFLGDELWIAVIESNANVKIV